ncbi:MAG TPA: glycosyltransferase [Lacunisphaera sp.]|nr:glycosyltransferase [Lacunisphaera sp.]
MRALLSVVGTRGDVQPLFALAMALRRRGGEARLCVPPNFIESARAMGFDARPVGVAMRMPRPGESNAAAARPPADLVTDQFESVAAAANECDLIVGANAHQYAAPSIAELNGIPFISAVYAPTALPSGENNKAWNQRALDRVNANRTHLGLNPISDVLSYVVTPKPWLAADRVLAPAPAIPGLDITQTGAWFVEDAHPLPPDVQQFLEAGEAPLYFGFGSMPVTERTIDPLLAAARVLGRRAIVAQGWGSLSVPGPSPDLLFISEVNHQALFPRVAAVVHHGGAGTTLTCARAGTPQVIVPMFSDQPYWASRVEELGIGSSVPFAELSAERLIRALTKALDPLVARAARDLSPRIYGGGAGDAAELILAVAR